MREKKVGKVMRKREKVIGILSVVILISCLTLGLSITSEYFSKYGDKHIVEEDTSTESTQSWYDNKNISLDNPKLIDVLNRSHYQPSFYTLGVDGSIFIGRWLLSCDIESITPEPYFIEITNDVANVSDKKLQLKRRLHLSVDSSEELLNVLKYKKSKQFQNLTNEVTLNRDISIKENTSVHTSSRAFISGITIKGQTTTADVYIDMSNDELTLKVKNIVKEMIDTHWINQNTFAFIE